MQNLNPSNQSIQFGEMPAGLIGEPAQAFPFAYASRPFEDEDGTIKYIGKSLAASGKLDVYVRMDPDFNFYMKSVKFSISALTGAEVSWALGDQVYDYQLNAMTPFTKHVAVSLSVMSSKTQYVLGGNNADPVRTGEAITPIEIKALQGYEYGTGELESPYFIAKSGVLHFEFKNKIASELFVDFAVFGYKVMI